MASAGEIQQIYTTCLLKTTGFLCQKGYPVTRNNSIVVDKKEIDEHVVVRLREPLHFQGWPYRSGSRNRIDILAKIEETIEFESGKCQRSTLHLNYFRLNGEKPVVCEAIRYDFDSNVQDRHPICHAQMSNIPIERLPESFAKPNDINKCLLANRHQAMKIPTAFVNFAGLFAMLIADHLHPETVYEFWQECKVYIEKIPDHVCGEIFDVIFSGRTLGSYGWYNWHDE